MSAESSQPASSLSPSNRGERERGERGFVRSVRPSACLAVVPEERTASTLEDLIRTNYYQNSSSQGINKRPNSNYALFSRGEANLFGVGLLNLQRESGIGAVRCRGQRQRLRKRRRRRRGGRAHTKLSFPYIPGKGDKGRAETASPPPLSNFSQ